MVVQSIEDGSMDTDAFLGLATGKITEETLRVVYAGLYQLITLALKQPNLKSEVC